MNIRRKYGSAAKAAWGRRLVSWLLCFAMAISLAPFAQARGTARENTYVLRVDTGADDGSSVLYFAVHYLDAAGTQRVEYVFPHEGSLDALYDDAVVSSTPRKRLETVTKLTGYKLDSYKDGNYEGLQANSTDYFLLEPAHTLKEFLGVDVFLRYPTETGSGRGWSCAGLYFFRADHVYATRMVGCYSNQTYLEFDGTLLAKMTAPFADLTLERSDYVFRMGQGGPGEYAMEAANEAYSSLDTPEYLMKLDLADVFGGGIEAMNFRRGTMTDTFAEVLTLNVRYIDCFGETRSAALPVLSSMLVWAEENGLLGSSGLTGLAQQGESLMFPAMLPDFREFSSIDLIYGVDASLQAGISKTGIRTENWSQRVHDVMADGFDNAVFNSEAERRLMETEQDPFQITGFTIYAGDVRLQHLAGDSLNLYVDSTCTPEFFYTADKAEGEQVRCGQPFDLLRRIDRYVPGARLSPAVPQGMYLFMIRTDTMPSAATREDIFFSVSYQALDGSVKTTQTVPLREAARELQGYVPVFRDDVSFTPEALSAGWPAYLESVSAGGLLLFTMQLNNVYKFNSVTLSMDSRSTDDWQMSEIVIYDCDWIGPRLATWGQTEVSDRVYTREFDDAPQNRIAWYPNLKEAESGNAPKIYLNGNSNTKTIEFNSENGRSVITDGDEETRIDWEKVRYSMTYKQAMSDLGFTQRAVTYTVNVNVASNEDATAADGDCGSDNLFYFKLIFKGGSSGYVLANQQLTSDGFRAGRTESFQITTNEDWGELSSILIIPETDSENENQDLFDKLKIDSITVVRPSSGGTSTTWEVKNVGWIGIDFVEKAAESTNTGRKGRTEAELARSYQKTSTGYSMNLLFEMTTPSGCYNKDTSSVNADLSDQNPQFVGSMIATLYYRDKDGLDRKYSFDLARAMSEYAGLEPNYYSGTYAQDDGASMKKAATNPQYMMRAGHIDRFIVPLVNVASLSRMTISLSSEVSTRWRMKNMTVSAITSDGVLQLNSNDEYERSNETVPICTSDSNHVGDYEVWTMAPQHEADELGTAQMLEFSFDENKIEIIPEENEWTSTITREPDNENDTVNIFVYMREDNTATDLEDYGMDMKLVYGHRLDGTERLVTLRNLDADPERNLFYALGVQTPCLNLIRQLTLQAQYLDYSASEAVEKDREHSWDQVIHAPIDHVVIQHVRTGVTIATYTVSFGGQDAWDPVTRLANQIQEKTNTEKQVVRLFFSEQTQPQSFVAGGMDIAVGIRYRTEQDTSAATYNSRYVYLTDLRDAVTGLPIYDGVYPGMVADVEFALSDLDEIVGVTVAGLGNIRAELDCAYAAVYDTVSGELKDWYNFAEPYSISTTPMTMQCSDRNVVPVRMVFRTSQTAEILSSGADSGKNAPIRMKVIYTSAVNGLKQELELENLRDYLVEGGFSYRDGGTNTAVVEFFMRDVGSIRSVELEPYAIDTYDTAVWGVDSVYCEAIINGEERSHSADVKTTVMMKKPLNVNLTTVVAQAEAYAYDPETGVSTKLSTGPNGNADFSVKPGREVVIMPDISGQLDGFGFKAQVVRRENGVDVPMPDTYLRYADQSVAFRAPENGSGAAETYVVFISAEEMPEAKATITVVVKPVQTEEKKEEKEEPVTPEPPAEDTPAEETPAEETPAEDTPAEETPAEDTPAEETPAEETPAEETPAPEEDTPADETPPAEEPSSEESAPEEQPPAEDEMHDGAYG